jgi:acetyl esterase/lipase
MSSHRLLRALITFAGVPFMLATHWGSVARSQELKLPLWPTAGVIPASAGEVIENSEILWVKNVHIPDIQVYLPTKQSATSQAVVVCPGGGYMGLAYDWEGKDIAKWLNANGIAAVVLKYRIPAAFTDSLKHFYALEDAQRALRLTRHHAKEWNIAPDRIGVMGFSAGGHLAATLGTMYDVQGPHKAEPIDTISARPDFMILMYPVITMNETSTHMGSRKALLGEHPDAGQIRRYSPELLVNDRTPPAFLVHAFDDGAVPVENSLLMFQALRSHNVPAEMHIFPTGGHGFSLATKPGKPDAWPALCIDWMKKLPAGH